MCKLNGTIIYFRCVIVGIIFFLSGCTTSNSICFNSKIEPSERIDACGTALESADNSKSHAALLLERAKSYRLLTNSIPVSSSALASDKNSSYLFSSSAIARVKQLQDGDNNPQVLALRDLNKAESILPPDERFLRTKVLLERADINRLIGNLDSAQKDILAASALSPNNPAPLVQLALHSFDQGNVIEGSKILTKALELEPTNVDANYYMMRQLQISGDHNECIKHGEKTGYTEEKNTLILAMKARCFAATGNEVDALKEIEKITTVQPAEAIVYQDMAMAYLDLGKPKDAAIAAERAILTDPSLPDAYFDWISALAAMKEYDKAITVYQIFKTTGIDDRIGIANNLAWELYLAGEYKFASNILLDWLDDNPAPLNDVHHISNRESYPIVLDSLAHILAALGQKEDAKSLFLRASDLGDDTFKNNYKIHLTKLGYTPNSNQVDFVSAITACVNARDKCRLYND